MANRSSWEVSSPQKAKDAACIYNLGGTAAVTAYRHAAECTNSASTSMLWQAVGRAAEAQEMLSAEVLQTSTTLPMEADTIQAAVLTYLEEAAQAEKEGRLVEGWAEAEITRQALSKKVRIQNAASAGYKDTTTRPVKEVFRAASREVRSKRGVRSASAKYRYTLTAEAEGKAEADREYHRLQAYHTAVEVYSDAEAEEIMAEIADLIAEAGLTAAQVEVLQLKLRGYGDKAAATFLGIKRDSVRDRRQAACRKIVAAIAARAEAEAEALDSIPAGNVQMLTEALQAEEAAAEAAMDTSSRLLAEARAAREAAAVEARQAARHTKGAAAVVAARAEAEAEAAKAEAAARQARLASLAMHAAEYAAEAAKAEAAAQAARKAADKAFYTHRAKSRLHTLQEAAAEAAQAAADARWKAQAAADALDTLKREK